MASPSPAALTELKAALGLSGWTEDPFEIAPSLKEWRNKWQGNTPLMLTPGTTAEVARAVEICARHGVAIVTQGGGTGLVGGQVPFGEVLLTTRRLRTVRDVTPLDDAMTVEAGITLLEAQQLAAEADRFFPLSLAAEGTATIGGVISTNAGGTAVLRYGMMRDLVLGIEAVMPDGQVFNGLKRLRKDNTGYDLRHLFIGSEGTLGVITAATMKLFPQPAARMTAWATLDTPQQALGLLQLAQTRLGAGLTGFEAMNQLALGLVRRHFPDLQQPLPPAPWTVLLEQSDTEDEAHARALFEGLLEAALAQGLITDAAVAESLDQSLAMWRLRESISLAQAEEGLNIKHDIALPVSRIPDFIARTDAALAAAFPGARLVNFGHLGDGNLHYNLQAPEGVSAADFLREQEPAVNRLVYDAVDAHGGSISAEHGIGQLKREELAERKSAVALDLMRRIKAALDPRGTLNPGRVLDMDSHGHSNIGER